MLVQVLGVVVPSQYLTRTHTTRRFLMHCEIQSGQRAAWIPFDRAIVASLATKGLQLRESYANTAVGTCSPQPCNAENAPPDSKRLDVHC